MDLQFGHLADYGTTANMQLASGEKMDIYLALPLNTAEANGYLLPLDEFVDNSLPELSVCQRLAAVRTADVLCMPFPAI